MAARLAVHAPLAFDIILRSFEQFARGFRIAANQHGVARFLIGVLLQGDAGRLGIEKERILAFEAKRGIVAHQWPVTAEHGLFLLVQTEDHVISVGNAMTVRDDERRPVVRFRFQERFYRVRVAGAHSHARDIDITVADRFHCQIFLAGVLSAGGKFGDRGTGRGLGHLPASVGIDFGVQHKDVDVAAANRARDRGRRSRCHRPSRLRRASQTLFFTSESATDCSAIGLPGEPVLTISFSARPRDGAALRFPVLSTDPLRANL